MQAVNQPNMSYESGLGQFAVSRAGTLVYASGGVFPPAAASLFRSDRSGAMTELERSRGETYGVRLSPDGRRMASLVYAATNRAKYDIEVYDLERGAATRMTSDGVSSWLTWSGDGRRVLFDANTNRIDAVPADGEGARETIVTGTGGPKPYPQAVPRMGMAGLSRAYGHKVATLGSADGGPWRAAAVSGIGVFDIGRRVLA
jgi:hypothetical protein